MSLVRAQASQPFHFREIAMPRQLNASEYTKPAAVGPRLEYVPTALIAALKAASIAASGNFTSPVISADGYYNFILGLTPSQAGTLTFQAFIDDAGTVPAAAAQTVALTGAAAAVLKVNCDQDGYTPFASFTVSISNSGGSAGTLSNVAALLSA
jgi:hypothetical protein